MKNFSKIALLTVLSFLTTSQVFTEIPEDKAAPLAAASPAAPKTDPTPLPAETLAKPIDDPKLTKVTPPAELKKEEDKVVPASVASEKKELAAPAAPAKSSWTVKSVLSGMASSFTGLLTSKSKTEAKKEESKPTTTEPLAVEPEKVVPVEKPETVAPATDPVAEKLAPKEPLALMTDEEKAAFLAASSPLKKSSSALAAATGIKPMVSPKSTTQPEKPVPVPDEPEKVMPAPTAEEEKVLTLKAGSATRAALAATEKIATEDDVLDVPASKKEVEEAVATIKATANPTMEAEDNIRKYWEAKNSSKRKEKIAAVAAISFFTGGIIGVTVVLPFVLRSLAKQLDKAEEEHLKKLQAEAQGAQAKLDALGKEATALDKLMVEQLGLNPDRLYPESNFNKTRGKEAERPTFTKLFRLLNNDPKEFLDAVENLREKEVAGLITDREKKQLGIIRNLRPEDIAPLGFFGSLAKYFGFPNKNETLEKIKSSWGKKYSSEEIAKLKEKHGAKTTTSEPAKKVEDDQKLKTTPPTEEPIDAAKKPKTQEELATDEAEKAKKTGTVIPEIATLDQIIQPTKTVVPVLPEPEKKEKTPPPPATAPQPEKIADPLENEEIKNLAPRPSTVTASVKRDKKIGSSTQAPTELTEEVEKALPEPVKTVSTPEKTKIIVPTEDASTVPAKAPDLVAASSEKLAYQATKVPAPAPEPAPKVVVSEKTPPLSPEAEKEKTANLAFDAARKVLSAQEIVKTTDQMINSIPEQVSAPLELITKTQSQFKELPPAQTLEDQKIPAAVDGDWPPEVLTKLQSRKNQTPLTKESTQKAAAVVTEEIKQNARIVAFSQQSGSTVKTVPQAPIKLNLRAAIPQPEPVEPSNVALTTKEKVAAASGRMEAQQIVPEDSIKALQAQITERKGSEISRALSYKDDRPDKESLTDLRMPVNDAIWKLAQEQSKTKGLPQNFLIDSAQLMADQFMSRRSERSAPLPPSTDAWTKANPEVERLTQSLGFGFGSQDSVAKKAESIATAKRLSSQTTTLLEQKREINPPLPPTSLPSPSSPRSPQQLYSHSSPTSKFMFGSPADVNRAWTQMSQQPLSQRPQSSPINVMGSPAAMGPSLAKPLHSPASINPGDIELLRRGFQQQNSSPSPKNDRPSESQPSRKMGL